MEASELSHWEVTGGRDQGGILVRTGQALSSPAETERLVTGSRVEQLELVGERLRYRLVAGAGPETGWVSTRLRQKDHVKELLVPIAPKSLDGTSDAAEATAAGDARGPVMRYFDLLRGPLDTRDLRAGELPEASEEGASPERIAEVLREYGVADFQVESLLRTELGRDKVFVKIPSLAGSPGTLFIGHMQVDDHRLAEVEASIDAFLQISQFCRPERISVTQFMKCRKGSFLHDGYLVSPAHGSSDWGRSARDRIMLATAIGELHRASKEASDRGVLRRAEEALVEHERGLDVLYWGLGADYSQSGLFDMDIHRIKFILSSLRGLDRADRIRELPKYVVHGDLQFKNVCRPSRGSGRGPVLVDCKLGHRASRLWDLYFILCGDDLCSLLPKDDETQNDFIEAVRQYETVSGVPFEDEESFLLMNTIMMKAIFTTCFFGTTAAGLPGSKRKCKAAYNTMEWIIARKDYFRSIF